jgi:signal transduction histidine kinase
MGNPIAEQRIKVLLIEDDPDCVLLVSLHLGEACGPNARYVIQSAETLAGARELLSSQDFDVVLLDLMLPDSQGLDGLAALRRQAPDLPVVVMTNLNDEEVGLQAIEQGAQDFLVKQKIDALVLKRAIGYARERSHLLSQFEGIIEGSAEGMLVVERTGRVLYVNPAALSFFGQKRDELLNRSFDFPLSPGTRREIRWKCNDAEKVGELRVAALEWRKDEAFLASIHDITELRKFEQLKAEIKERRRIDELKDEFLSTVSHELRSPLTVIKAVVVNLWEGLAGPMSGPQNELVKIAVRNVERLARIINNVLDISRLESGHAQVCPAPVDLARLVKETVDLQSREEATLVFADPDMLSQVLHNLLDNAMRFAKSKVEVSVSAPTPDQVQVTVIDDGPGIPKERLPELFDKFVQVNRPKGGSGYKGTGLGLAICHEILRLNEGRIWVESEPGSGTRFHFVVPRHVGTAAPQAFTHGKSSK